MSVALSSNAVTAFDLSVEPIAKARAAFPTSRSRDVMADPSVGQCELVVSSEVIEHIDDQAAFADSLVDVTQPGGSILLTTPNGFLRERRPDPAGGAGEPRPQPRPGAADPTTPPGIGAARRGAGVSSSSTTSWPRPSRAA